MAGFTRFGAVIISAAVMGCAGTATDTAADSELLQGANEDTATISSELTGGVAIGSTLKTTASLNLRTGAGMGFRVRLVIPQGARVTSINRSTPDGSWYNVRYNGIEGWVHGGYLTLVSAPSQPSTPSTSSGRDQAIARAKSGVGFGYRWGKGRWIPNGVTSANKGVCTGSCPNCTYRGEYGADCSGYAAKVWTVPSSNNVMTVESHPYSTWNFNAANSQWSTVSRSSLKKADALVYNDGRAGHIVIYESGDGWGSSWTYEARGCAYGIVHNLRSFGSAYKGIARTGY
ncbi:MAG: SH3 domain-containing protein [Myxococcales bacterium]|nr:SH3 domain-containing protein [Myxococcales bacterium]